MATDAEIRDLPKAMRRWHGMRIAMVVSGVGSAIGLAVGKFLADDPATEQTALLVLLLAIALLLVTGVLWLVTSRMQRRLLAVQMADLEREGLKMRAAAQGKRLPNLVTAADHGPEPDLRFTSPDGRKAMRRRSWMMFALAFVFLALAEFQYSERANLPMTAAYALVGLVTLVYAVILQQRLRAAG